MGEVARRSVNRIRLSGRIMFVPIARLHVNPVAQRRLDPTWAQKLANNFDPEAVGAILVNKREDTLHVIDGAHRIEMFKLIGWGDQQIECEVFFDLTDQQEAELFLQRNTRRAVNVMDHYFVSLTAQDPDICEIDRVVREQGYVVTRQKSDKGIKAVGALKKVYYRSDSETLAKTLRLAGGAFGASGFDGVVIDGLGLLNQRFNGQLNEEHAITRLAKLNQGVYGLLSLAEQKRLKTGSPKAHCVAAAAVEIINRGRGGKKLPSWWKAEDES